MLQTEQDANGEIVSGTEKHDRKETVCPQSSSQLSG